VGSVSNVLFSLEKKLLFAAYFVAGGTSAKSEPTSHHLRFPRTPSTWVVFPTPFAVEEIINT